MFNVAFLGAHFGDRLGLCRILFWHSPSSILAVAESNAGIRRVPFRRADTWNHNMFFFQSRMLFLKFRLHFWGALKIRMLFRKSCLRFWEPRPSEQGGFRHRSLYVLISRLLPPASSLFLILIRSGRQPSGTHP